MNIRWKNNIALKIIALIFAILLWWIVANVDDPITTKSFQTTVNVIHPEVITNIGKSYHVEDNTQSVRVTVKARRSVVESIRATDIQATADLRELQDSMIPIRIKITKYEGQYEEASATPQNLRVTTEDTQKKTFPITSQTIGEVSDGYVLGELVPSPKSIDISGPRTLIGRISKVVAKVDVTGLSESRKLKAELIYYDSADNIIDKSQLSSNLDTNGVKVRVEILQTKQLELQFDTSLIGVASGYNFKELTINEQEIVVCGSSEDLEKLDEILIPAEALRQSKLKTNKEVIIDVTKYLPDGVQLKDEDAKNIVVTIIVDKSGTKSILLPVRSVKVNNLSELFELGYGSEQEIELNFRGSAKNLEKLTENNIIAVIDMAAYQTEGTYDVTVQLLDMPDGCQYIGDVKVQVTLTKKDEQTGE